MRIAGILPVMLGTLLCVQGGCRAIGRFGESRQTIAARRLSGQGFQAMHDGRWEIAETLFADALRISSSDDRAHWGLAESYWRKERPEEAIKHMEHAVRLSAGDPRMVQRLGRMYLELDRPREADQHSMWALELQRDSAEAWALRGDCLFAGGQPEEALAAYHRALAIQPDYPQVQLKTAEIYRDADRFDRVLATLDRLQAGTGVEDAPPRVDMLQGIAMRHLGRMDEARRCFGRAASKAPEDATPHLELASLSLLQGDLIAAQSSLEQARLIDPESISTEQWQALQTQQNRLAADPRDQPPPASEHR